MGRRYLPASDQGTTAAQPRWSKASRWLSSLDATVGNRTGTDPGAVIRGLNTARHRFPSRTALETHRMLLPPRDDRIPALLRALRVCPFSLAAIVLLVGCASAPPVEEARPIDAGQLAASAERASELDAPYRVVFSWSLNEPGMRLQGQGVARLEPPYRARLDLFNGSGERITAAALVDGEVRMPADLPSVLPESTLVWASLGVFRPTSGMWLAGGSWRSDGAAELRYLPSEGSELLVRLERSRIRDMEVRTGGRTVEDLRLTLGNGERFPREATYRDLRNTRELRITLESVEHVESFPTHVWDPSR